jgi:UDP-galactose transporter
MNTGNIDFTDSSFEAGLVVLLVAQLLSAWMGIYVQDLYAEHGKHWDQNLFYSHLLSLPMFLPLGNTLTLQFKRLRATPPLIFSPAVAEHVPIFIQKLLASTPTGVFMLTLNSITQLICITGVNLLSAKTSAVTVTIVLNIRKLVSFMFSIWLFGNKMGGQMMIGATIVFTSGAIYGWETSVGIRRRQLKTNAMTADRANAKNL